MATTLPRTALAVWLGLTTLAVAAQTAPAAGGAPSSTAAAAPSAAASAAAAAAARAPYRSVFTDYRGMSEQPLAPWRASNDTVGTIGGWRAYARESQGEPAAPTKPSSTPEAAPAPKRAASPEAAPAPKPAPRSGGHAEHHR